MKKPAYYNELYRKFEALLGDERDWLANTSNTAALLFNEMEDINWAGFYFFKQGALVLGPFQGQPACIRIPMGKGVCGTAAQTREIQIVPDVHRFPGHIACDAASRSEIVLPILAQERLIGVLDIDSPIYSRFTEEDAEGLHRIVHKLAVSCDW